MFKYINRNDLIKLANNSDVLVVLDRQIDMPTFDGITTTLTDIHLNLTDLGISAPLIMIVRNPNRMAQFLIKSKRSLPLDDMSLYMVKYDDAINVHTPRMITSFNNIMTNNDYVLIADKRLIILGSGTILSDDFYRNKKGINYTLNLPNVKILGNEYHRPYIGNNDLFSVYRQKFSLKRLSTLAKNFIPKNYDFSELERLNYKNTNLTEDNMCAKSLYYQRWAQVIPGVYNENIGKMIFEFRWLNRPVHYSSVNRSHTDGLSEYLALFEVDDTITQDLTFTKDDIDKLLVGLTIDDILVKTIFE